MRHWYTIELIRCTMDRLADSITRFFTSLVLNSISSGRTYSPRDPIQNILLMASMRQSTSKTSFIRSRAYSLSSFVFSSIVAFVLSGARYIIMLFRLASLSNCSLTCVRVSCKTVWASFRSPVISVYILSFTFWVISVFKSFYFLSCFVCTWHRIMVNLLQGLIHCRMGNVVFFGITGIDNITFSLINEMLKFNIWKYMLV